MDFLVILAALLINHYWQKDRALPGDKWFARFVSWMQAPMARLPRSMRESQELRVVLIVAIPVVALLALLYVIDGVLFGLVSFCVHVALLLALFDPRNLHTWIERYLQLWREEKFESAILYLQERWPAIRIYSDTDYEALHESGYRFILMDAFERLFAVLFWYLVLGPVGAIVYYALVQLRGLSYLDFTATNEHWLHRLIFVLEWPVARLLGLTFSLAGDFDAGFKRLRELFLASKRSAIDVVVLCAHAAAGTGYKALVVHDSQETGEMNTLVIDLEEGASAITPRQCTQQVEDLVALLDRSQIIWISTLALLAFYGIGA